MKINEFGEVILNAEDIFQGLYSGKITELSKINIDDIELVEKFNRYRRLNADTFPEIKLINEHTCSVEEFDRNNQKNWYMPEEYRNLEIDAYLLSLCTTEDEFSRVAEELELFYQHNMLDVLKYLKYLVDTMRANNIVWGVGRGSSVASYCLYLLGVHRINSMKYNLDINEFLK